MWTVFAQNRSRLLPQRRCFASLGFVYLFVHAVCVDEFVAPHGRFAVGDFGRLFRRRSASHTVLQPTRICFGRRFFGVFGIFQRFWVPIFSARHAQTSVLLLSSLWNILADFAVLSAAALGLDVKVVVRLHRVALQDRRVDRRASALHLVFAQQRRVLVAVGRRHAAAVAERPDSHRLAYLVVWRGIPSVRGNA